MLRVRDLMQTELRTLDRNDVLRVADEVMREEAIRHMPVLDGDGELCGVVSQRDIFRGALLRALGYGERAAGLMLDRILVKETMTADPVCVGPDETAAAAAARMLEHKIGCLPVVEGKRLVGIVTESDLLRAVASDRA